MSTVAENGSVKHLCLDSKQLYSRALEVSLAAAVLICHLHRLLWDGAGPGIDHCGVAMPQGIGCFGICLEVSLAAPVQVSHLHRLLWEGTSPGIDHDGTAMSQG